MVGVTLFGAFGALLLGWFWYGGCFVGVAGVYAQYKSWEKENGEIKHLEFRMHERINDLKRNKLNVRKANKKVADLEIFAHEKEESSQADPSDQEYTGNDYS